MEFLQDLLYSKNIKNICIILQKHAFQNIFQKYIYIIHNNVRMILKRYILIIIWINHEGKKLRKDIQ